ncbi:MAG: class I SAM-dependent methyltransferase [Myxococcota bacterium]|nr:class I SAM-dependent methyltransferase [Myxococcota bacterium]
MTNMDYKHFEAMNARFLREGYDRKEAARFIVRTAGGLFGPALDVGTGQGLLAVALARADLSVVSVDPDAQAQSVAAQFAAEAKVAHLVEFLPRDAVFVPYPDGYFGCVAMMNVLHHIEEPRPIFREMARLVRPSGRIIVADFDEEGFELVARIHREEGREHPRTTTTIELAEQELCQAGLSLLARAHGFFHHVVVMTKSIR